VAKLVGIGEVLAVPSDEEIAPMIRGQRQVQRISERISWHLVALFGDFGDVIRGPMLYFTEPNPAVGFGFRYVTPVGAIRFDIGFRVGNIPPGADEIPLLSTPGAMHLTLGEAF
jgi:hypothetical protein